MKKIILLLVLLSTQNVFSYWQCYARNSYGIDFWGTGSTKYDASRKALFACETNTDLLVRCWVTNWCDWKY